MSLPGIFVTTTGSGFDSVIRGMDEATQEWERRAARGECGWICADCCVSFPEGMPDACEHGDKGCTSIIRRNKGLI